MSSGQLPGSCPSTAHVVGVEKGRNSKDCYITDKLQCLANEPSGKWVKELAEKCSHLTLQTLVADAFLKDGTSNWSNVVSAKNLGNEPGQKQALFQAELQ